MNLIKEKINLLRRKNTKAPQIENVSMDYWTKHNVTSHRQFINKNESLEYFHWRNAQYFNYLKLMPVSNLDEKIILDYGCGPGNDLVGFGCYSKPKKLFGLDVSPTSLDQSKKRVAMHEIQADLIKITPGEQMPLSDASVDYIHCSGVLHHIKNPQAVLRDFKRVLKPDGEARIMIYNYNSIWLHLYVAYIKQITEGSYAELDIKTAFQKTTDGPNCPVSYPYDANEFIDTCAQTGFRCEYLGSSVSMWEMSLLGRRFDAIMNQSLKQEHRDFLATLKFDSQGYPMFKDHHAGIGACFSLRKD